MHPMTFNDDPERARVRGNAQNGLAKAPTGAENCAMSTVSVISTGFSTAC